jgi:hypothetical protein
MAFCDILLHCIHARWLVDEHLRRARPGEFEIKGRIPSRRGEVYGAEMQLSEKQVAAVCALPGPERYKHFVKRVADQEEVWGLYQDGWALAGTNERERVFPLWSAKEYAELCATGHWAGYQPKRIAIAEVLDDLLPSLVEDEVLVGVFPIVADDNSNKDVGVTPSHEQFKADILSALARY